jgi:L-alanine-DL-glutamate epimerase-like enolase superfamily enzyme
MTDMISRPSVRQCCACRPDTPWLKGHAFGDARNLLVLEVETKGGIVGQGHLFSFRPGLKTIAAALEETIVPRVIGKDATAVEGIWNDLWKATVTYNRGGIVTMAMSALDIALWDAIGKRANLPLHRLWGHVRSELPVYGSGCFRGAGGDGMIAKALHYKSRGYKAIKMQMAHTTDLHRDVDNVRRMREALGPDIDIMIDVNMGWSADVAIEMGRKFEQYDIYWLEEPVPADDFAGYQRIAAALDMRVVGGETHFTRYDLRPFFLNPCLPILQPDPMRGATPICADRGPRRHLGHHHRATPVPGIERAVVGFDPQRTLDRGHGPVGRSVRRAGAGCERHDHRAGAARPRPGIQAGNPARLPGMMHP